MKNQTKRIIEITVATTLVTLAAWAQTSRFLYSVKTMPPSVVKTVPVASATDVDPNLKEITVSFSKEMSGGYSAPQTTPDENYPESGEGRMHFLPDKRTCVMPVKLQPGRTYVVWFNHGQFMNFRDTDGKSAVPYLLVFETKK